MKCDIISASAGTGKTYTMAIKYLLALNEGVNFENILVITFTKKATAEIRERIIIFLKKIIFKEPGYEDILASMSTQIDYKNLKKAYENMLKNSENIKIFTNDSFINKIFTKTICPRYNIYNFETEETNSVEYLKKLLNALVSNKEYFKIFKTFYNLDENSKEIDKYYDVINNILENRPNIYNYLDDLSNVQREKVEDFCEIKGEIIQYLSDKTNLTKLAKSFLSANNITELEDFTTSGLVSRAKNEFETYFKEELVPKLAKIYINEVIIPYNIAYKKLAKICYTLDEKLKFNYHNFTFSDKAFYTYKYNIDPVDVFPNIDIIMIDEFQDTDPIQFEIILRLVAYAKKLFIVGDEKQAIYSFRGGDVSLFRNLENILSNRFKDISIKRSTLTTCYRSTNNIIDYVNNYFKDIPNFNYNKVLCKKTGGYVKVFNNDDLINHLVENKLYTNTAILARTNSDLDVYKKYLEKNNIHYESIQSIRLYNDKNVINLMYLIDYLVTTNSYSLFKFLRSDLVGYTLEQIKEIINGKKVLEVEKLKLAKNNFKKTYLKLFGYGINYDNEDILNINKFLNLVDQYPNLKEFYDYFKTKGKNILKDSASIENGVSLITMHKSKGLEYDSVYVPVKYSEENFAKFTLVKTEDNVIFLKKKKYIVLTQFEKYINIYQEKEKLEFYNLIYVALTRAKKNLIIIPDKKSLGIFSDYEIGKIENSDTVEQNTSTAVFTNKDFFGVTEYKKKNYENTSISKEISRKKGLAVHYFMENIKTKKDIDFAYSMFLRKYANLVGPILTDKIYKACTEYIKKYEYIFADQFEVYNEYEIEDSMGNKFRIDRMNVDRKNNEIIIYDYKTKKDAELSETYQQQLNNYKNIIENTEEFKNFSVKTKILPIIF